MLIKDIRDYIINPALKACSLWSQAAENLLVLTLCAETGGKFLMQQNGGALGIFQIEPETHDSIKKTLNHRDNRLLLERILSTCLLEYLPPNETLVYHLRYSTLIARMVYKRHMEPLPDADSAINLAKYYKKYFNTADGASTVQKAYDDYMHLGAI